MILSYSFIKEKKAEAVEGGAKHMGGTSELFPLAFKERQEMLSKKTKPIGWLTLEFDFEK